jgi:hypothetical protein
MTIPNNMLLLIKKGSSSGCAQSSYPVQPKIESIKHTTMQPDTARIFIGPDHHHALYQEENTSTVPILKLVRTESIEIIAKAEVDLFQ